MPRGARVAPQRPRACRPAASQGSGLPRALHPAPRMRSCRPRWHEEGALKYRVWLRGCALRRRASRLTVRAQLRAQEAEHDGTAACTAWRIAPTCGLGRPRCSGTPKADITRRRPTRARALSEEGPKGGGRRAPVCWNSTSGPAGPVLSRLMNAPSSAAHLLRAMKPARGAPAAKPDSLIVSGPGRGSVDGSAPGADTPGTPAPRRLLCTACGS